MGPLEIPVAFASEAGAQPHRDRHSSGRKNRLACETLSRRHSRRAVFNKASTVKSKKLGNVIQKWKRMSRFYPNATILGGETVISARSTIGANLFLTTAA
jgi:hypothetical protein